MTGEQQSDDEPDFLEDFILEEETPAKEALDELFETPEATATTPATPPPVALAVPRVPAMGKPGLSAAAADADDVLFTDHTQGLQPSESFAEGKHFSETASSTWQGDGLELDTPGVPVDDEQGTGIETGEVAKAVDPAEVTFAAELDSLLQSEDEFAIETDKELQFDETADSLLDPRTDAVDTFVIDDGAGAWQGDNAESAEGAEALAESQAAAEGEAMPFEVVAETGEIEPGWEPLPGTSMDELAEVGGVERVDGDDQVAEQEAAAAALVPQPLAIVGQADAGQEIYADGVANEPVAVVGGRRSSPRAFRLVASLAASLAILSSAALLVWRPDWLGLGAEPTQVLSVQVQRPRLEVTVAAPPLPLADAPRTTGTPAAGTNGTSPGSAVGGQPSVVTVEPPPVAPTPSIEVPAQPVASPEPPVVAQGPGAPAAVNVPSPPDGQKNWPVPVAVNAPQNPAPAVPGLPEGLVRVGEDLLIGNLVDAPRAAVDGMLPGSKAFAQLHNGNYFIGSVKFTDAETVTLRVPSGEITLARASLAKLTMLGSTDYEELQRVTSGFVRLTNNNRLVGSILAGIADDHIVLESRSHRVMLPKSAIGEVVQGAGDGGVRLSTTREEDDWVRQLSERQLGGTRNDAQGSTPSPSPSPTRLGNQ